MENKQNNKTIDFVDENVKQGILHAEVDKDLLKLFKITCIEHNKTMKEGLSEAINAFIQEKEKSG